MSIICPIESPPVPSDLRVVCCKSASICSQPARHFFVKISSCLSSLAFFSDVFVGVGAYFGIRITLSASFNYFPFWLALLSLAALPFFAPFSLLLPSPFCSLLTPRFSSFPLSRSHTFLLSFSSFLIFTYRFNISILFSNHSLLLKN